MARLDRHGPFARRERLAALDVLVGLQHVDVRQATLTAHGIDHGRRVAPGGDGRVDGGVAFRAGRPAERRGQARLGRLGEIGLHPADSRGAQLGVARAEGVEEDAVAQRHRLDQLQHSPLARVGVEHRGHGADRAGVGARPDRGGHLAGVAAGRVQRVDAMRRVVDGQGKVVEAVDVEDEIEREALEQHRLEHEELLGLLETAERERQHDHAPAAERRVRLGQGGAEVGLHRVGEDLGHAAAEDRDHVVARLPRVGVSVAGHRQQAKGVERRRVALPRPGAGAAGEPDVRVEVVEPAAGVAVGVAHRRPARSAIRPIRPGGVRA